MKNSWIFCLFLAFLSLSGCLDPIDLNLPRGAQSAIVINGKMVYDSPTTFVEVTVDRLFAFDAASRQRVPTISITLIEENGMEYPLEQDFLSTFSANIPVNDPDFPIQFGHLYKVRVETLRDGSFESDWEPLLPVPKIKAVHIDSFIESAYSERFDRVLDLQLYRFSVSTDLSVDGQSEKSRLLWTNENFTNAPPPNPTCGEFSTVFMRVPVVFDGTPNTQETLDSFELTTYRDIDFSSSQVCISVYQQSLSASAYEYWMQAREIMRERDGNMLEPAPGQITSNFKGINGTSTLALGFFYATQQDTFHFTLK